MPTNPFIHKYGNSEYVRNGNYHDQQAACDEYQRKVCSGFPLNSSSQIKLYRPAIYYDLKQEGNPMR